MTGYRQTLNINNSSRLVNLNLCLLKDIKDFETVSPLSEQKIEGRMRRLKKESARFKHHDDSHYLIFHEKNDNDDLINLLFDHGGRVSYYTDGVVPYYVMKKMAQCQGSEAIFPLKKMYSDQEIRNVQMTSAATQTQIDMTAVLPDLNPYDCLFSLFDLRYHVDRVQLSFPPLMKKEMASNREMFYAYSREDKLYHLKTSYKWDFYQIIREPLSKWKMNIWFVCENQEELEMVDHWAFPNKKKAKEVDDV